jgi:energy-coupling factor transporter ATP-binding protein EcfA2
MKCDPVSEGDPMKKTYGSFKVLPDDPSTSPSLGFEDYAAALADVVLTSTPRFAIGIFGSWGSGKTTLMRAIRERLRKREDVVTVWFNAWRYEREPHLVVPLLDVLRESLDERAAVQSEEQASRTRLAAKAIARAGKALLTGVTLSAHVVGVEAQLDLGRVMDGLTNDSKAQNAAEPLSFYHAGFVMLREAIGEFSQSGAQRVVVFIDDLDRCLPANALEVLESMKLFFDMEGFVFVAGLDQAVVERAVMLKYQLAGDAEGATLTGTNYLKKVFQVPFTLPRVSPSQLDEYLDGIAARAALVPAQQHDFDTNVRRHLEFLSGEESVNPREVKRLVNAYTMQLKMLSARLGKIDPNVVLALQCMSFRPDWQGLYESLVSDPTLFQSQVREARKDDVKENVVWLAGRRVTLPPAFIRYIDGRALSLLTEARLELYVSAVESARTTDPSLLDAYRILASLRREIEQLPSRVSPQLFFEVQSRLKARQKTQAEAGLKI